MNDGTLRRQLLLIGLAAAISLAGCAKTGKDNAGAERDASSEPQAQAPGEQARPIEGSGMPARLGRGLRRPPRSERHAAEREQIRQQERARRLESILAETDPDPLRAEDLELLRPPDEGSKDPILAGRATPLGTSRTRGELHVERFGKSYKGLSFERVYGAKVQPPPLDLDRDLTELDLPDLVLLRNRIFARHGYLFNNAFFRDHFEQFDWYQPIYWKPERRIELSEGEQELLQRILAHEELLLQKNHHLVDGVELGRWEQVVNRVQFESIPPRLETMLKEQNFAVNWALSEGNYRHRNEELYHIYDRNLYRGLPSYITTDLYLRLLNLHYKYLLMELESEELLPLLGHLTTGLHEEMLQLRRSGELAEDQVAAVDRNLLLLGVAGNLLQPGSCAIPDGIKLIYTPLFDRAQNASGLGAPGMDAPLFDFSLLKVRGNYTTRPELGRYFKAMRWLNSLALKIDRPSSLQAALLLATAAEQRPDLAAAWNRIERGLALFAGRGDNLSLNELRRALAEHAPGASWKELNDRELLAAVFKTLRARDPQRIRGISPVPELQREYNRPQVVLIPTRYMFDGEILQRLMDKQRHLPRALDVFAVLQRGPAEALLLEHFREGKGWPGYPVRLKELQRELAPRINWNRSLYDKRMELIHTIQSRDPRAPGYMKQQAWSYKDLNTALAAWTQLKHETLLYTRQPVFAQAGQGGGPPPPIIPGYVEPNTAFWRSSLELLEATARALENAQMLNSERTRNLSRCYAIAEFCLRISEKQLGGEQVDDREMEEIMWLAARIEHLMREIIPDDVINEKMPIAVDVASSLITDDLCLQEAIGLADEIFVIAEINGRLYLTRGAVMSHFEFTQSINDRLTDEQWRERLKAVNLPDRARWTLEYGGLVGSPEVKPHFGSHSSIRTFR